MKIQISAGNYSLAPDASWKQVVLEEIFLECKSSTGAINIFLPGIALMAGFRNAKIFISDVDGQASVNNITITSDVADSIGNAASVVMDIDKSTNQLEIVGDNLWACFESEVAVVTPQTVREKFIRVDAVYGNDILAAADPYNTNVTPFQTVTAANAAAAATDTIVLIGSAKYSFTGPDLYRDGGALEIQKGCTLEWAAPGTVLSGGSRSVEFTIYGEGTLDTLQTLDADATANKIINIYCHRLITRGNGLCFADGTPLFRIDVDVWDIPAATVAAGFFIAGAPIIQAKFKTGTWNVVTFGGFVFSALGSSGNEESFFDFDVLQLNSQGLFQVQSNTSADYKIRVSGKVNSLTTTTTAGVITTTGSPAATINSKLDITCIKYAYLISGATKGKIEGSIFSTTTGVGVETPAILVNHASAEINIVNSNISATIANGGAVWAQRGLVFIDDCEITNENSGAATAYPLQVGINGGTSVGLITAVLKSVYLLSDPANANLGASPSIYVDAASGGSILQYVGTITTNGGANANAAAGETIGAYVVQNFASFSKVPKV